MFHRENKKKQITEILMNNMKQSKMMTHETTQKNIGLFLTRAWEVQIVKRRNAKTLILWEKGGKIGMYSYSR